MHQGSSGMGLDSRVQVNWREKGMTHLLMARGKGKNAIHAFHNQAQAGQPRGGGRSAHAPHRAALPA